MTTKFADYYYFGAHHQSGYGPFGPTITDVQPSRQTAYGSPPNDDRTVNTVDNNDTYASNFPLNYGNDLSSECYVGSSFSCAVSLPYFSSSASSTSSSTSSSSGTSTLCGADLRPPVFGVASTSSFSTMIQSISGDGITDKKPKIKSELCDNRPSGKTKRSRAERDTAADARVHRRRRYKTPSPQLLRVRREAANARERRRMNNLNVAFEQLRTVLPEMENGRRLSKFETLQMAQRYIDSLSDILQQPPTAPPHSDDYYKKVVASMTF